MTDPDSSTILGLNVNFLEELYSSYLNESDSISDEWHQYFSEIEKNCTSNSKKRVEVSNTLLENNFVSKQVAVLQLINAYRFIGHRQSNLDPLNQYHRPDMGVLLPSNYDLSEADMDSVFNTGSLFGADEAPLKEIIHLLNKTYCNTIGAEYMHITETYQKRWLQEYLETNDIPSMFEDGRKKQILERIISANSLEEYLHIKFSGQKRFSLEGCETLIPSLDEIIQSASMHGIKEIVIGMAHRGRINVLVNTIGKSPNELFDEFEGKKKTELRSGDVKYHMGYSSDIEAIGGSVHLTLAFNPSHLEIIDPVVQGSVRAKQDRREDTSRDEVLPILIHGDSAFAGQGVVMETFNLSQTRGYRTGGTIHIVINNQIGFTTSDPLDSRSTFYCTDVAKIVQAPIFHVNGDDPEAAVFIAKLALDYVKEFRRDVVIDLICYRKHGHSEADEPAATQPIMYQHVKSHPGVKNIYSRKLLSEKVITKAEIDDIHNEYIKSLNSNQHVVSHFKNGAQFDYAIDYSPFKNTHWTELADTSIPLNKVQDLTKIICNVPITYKLHKSVKKLLTTRLKMGHGETNIDWGFAENLAYASLIDDNFPIRISGQDSERGTFFHRHAVVHNQDNGETFIPLQHVKVNQAQFSVINSTLSEAAVLAYEYGYSSAQPNSLVIWEAQFGDFANNAQVVFDQFICSCEAKWGIYCGMVILLPHGYDGQGPEHSSARLERYLQLCAEDNIQVCVPSTSAQMFHLLRRQMLRPYRKPLIVISPKSLLRNKLSFSNLNDIVDGSFNLVINEVDNLSLNKITRLLLCSGKVYYDLLEERRRKEIKNIAIVRIEQLYPFPTDKVKEIINQYHMAKEIVWVQEEPKNQGSWQYMQSEDTLMECITEVHKLEYAGRAPSASPAVGYYPLHLKQQRQLVNIALGIDELNIDSKTA